VQALLESDPAWTLIGWSQRFATLRERVRAQLRLDGGRLGGFGLAAPVEPFLEVTAQFLARRTERIPRPPRLEPKDPHLLVTRAVAARVALAFRKLTHPHGATVEARPDGTRRMLR
jgi:hypothetical protein